MTALEIIPLLEARLAEAGSRVGPHDWNDRTWHARWDAENRAIAEWLAAEHGARVRGEWNGARLAMAGVSATCTSGLGGVFTNWIAAVRRKAGQ